MSYIHFIGIDVSKNWFDAALYGQAAKPARFKNSSEGFAAFANNFKDSLGQALVVLESTGGYETALLTHLTAAGISVHRADPLSAKHFIRSLGQRGKSDALDAIALARYAYERHDRLACWKPLDPLQEGLSDLMARRADLVAFKVTEQTRLKHPRYATLQKSLHAMIRTIEKQLCDIEGQITQLVKASPRLQQKCDILIKVKGVGLKTAHTLLASMPELGTLTRRQAASLAGCAPHPKDSGLKQAYRSTSGGRANVKRALYMATLSAVRSNPDLKTFYNRLKQNGKKPMVALTAAMRKLITILNAKLRDHKYA